MSYKYEKIDFNELLGANISIHEIDVIQSHWHESMEILFVTKGEVHLLVDGVSYHLKQDDVMIINSKEIHSVKSNTENILIAIQLDLNQFSNLYKSIEKMIFKCRSFEHDKEDERFTFIRQLLTQIISYDMLQESVHSLKISALLYELVYILVHTFAISTDIKNETKSFKHLDRLNRVVDYLQQNYHQDITLSYISGMEGLSPQYFSKFFEKHMGVNFLTYLNLIRLEHAVKDLINTDYNITDIALNHGFPNVTSFTTLFKNTYNETPSVYRKKLSHQDEMKHPSRNQGMHYIEYNTNHLSESIFKYLVQDEKKTMLNLDRIATVNHTIELDVSQKTVPISPCWRRLMTFGKAKEGLMKEVQSHLIDIQKEISFDYIRFHGIFDDTMMVYGEDISQCPQFNFIYVDQLFDFLLSIGLRPFVELGFMPSKLAKRTDKTVFYTESIISEPKDIQLWNLLVDQFIKHCINRYGLNEVKQWYFEVWNEPDFVKYFGFETPKYYDEFFKETYQTIKRIHPKLQVGGPSIIGHTITKTKWLTHYLTYCQTYQCIPDFISFHSYPMELVEEMSLVSLEANEFEFNLDVNKEFAKDTLSWGKEAITKFYLDKNEDYLSDLITKLKSTLKALNLDYIPLFLSEWNSTPSHRDLTNDTLYKASYIIKNYLDNMDRIDGFGYWLATDLLEEFRLEQDVFHGGLGLITNNGIKKPGFYAYTFLKKLGDEVIDRGAGYMVTKQDDEYQVLLYNYCHLNDQYCEGDLSNIDQYNRYYVFNDKEKSFSISLNQLPPGVFESKVYSLSKQAGSAFDTWLEMGHPTQIDQEDLSYITYHSHPNLKKGRVFLEGKYTINERLAPHEVKLYTLKPIY